VLFLCTGLNSDDPEHVHVTCVSSGAWSKDEAWPSFSVYGDKDKPMLVTYPDVALNHVPLLLLDFFW
jgi:hypothetical protein